MACHRRFVHDQGLPKEWETMLRSAGIDPEEFNKHKGAAVKAVEFYQNMINVQPRTLRLCLLHLRLSFCGYGWL
jgi:hypothetical protein